MLAHLAPRAHLPDMDQHRTAARAHPRATRARGGAGPRRGGARRRHRDARRLALHRPRALRGRAALHLRPRARICSPRRRCCPNPTWRSRTIIMALPLDPVARRQRPRPRLRQRLPPSRHAADRGSGRRRRQAHRLSLSRLGLQARRRAHRHAARRMLSRARQGGARAGQLSLRRSGRADLVRQARRRPTSPTCSRSPPTSMPSRSPTSSSIAARRMTSRPIGSWSSTPSSKAITSSGSTPRPSPPSSPTGSPSPTRSAATSAPRSGRADYLSQGRSRRLGGAAPRGDLHLSDFPGLGGDRQPRLHQFADRDAAVGRAHPGRGRHADPGGAGHERGRGALAAQLGPARRRHLRRRGFPRRRAGAAGPGVGRDRHASCSARSNMASPISTPRSKQRSALRSFSRRA